MTASEAQISVLKSEAQHKERKTIVSQREDGTLLRTDQSLNIRSFEVKCRQGQRRPQPEKPFIPIGKRCRTLRIAMNSVRQLECAIVKGNTKKVVSITQKCLEEGIPPSLLIEDGILKAAIRFM